LAKAPGNYTSLVGSIWNENSISKCSGEFDTQTVGNRNVEHIENVKGVLDNTAADVFFPNTPTMKSFGENFGALPLALQIGLVILERRWIMDSS
jgi:hypothetical protein